MNVASKLSLFLAELKRRKVVRVAVVYALVGLGVIEGAQMILPTLQLEAAYDYIVIFVLFGFPVALVLAWALEVTPHGIQRTPDLTPEELASQTPERWKASTWVLSAVGVGLLIAAGYFVFFLSPGETRGPQGRVAVFPLENLTGDPNLDALGAAAAHWITSGLSSVEEVEVVATNAVLQSVEGRLEGVTDREIAADLGAGTMVSGVITFRGEDLELSAQITEVSSGSVMGTAGASLPGAEEMAVVALLRDRVMGSLSVSLEDPSSPWASDPPVYEAYHAYLRSVRNIFSGNVREAVEQASEAYRIDPSFLAPLVLEATARVSAGEDAAADSVFAMLEARREELSVGERSAVDYWRAVMDGEPEEMLRSARLLVQENPNSNGSLAAAAILMGRPEEALQALSALPRLIPAVGAANPQRIIGCLANLMLKRYRDALESTANLAPELDENLLSQQCEIHALIGLGRLDQIEPLLDEVEGMDPMLGMWSLTSGRVLLNLASVLARFGHADKAREVADRALSWYRDRDPEAIYRQVEALLISDRSEDALQLLEASFEESSQTPPASIPVRSYLGIALALTHDLHGAEAQARWFEEEDLPDLRGSTAYYEAALLAHLDRKDEAVRLLQQAFIEGRRQYSLSTLTSLWADPLFKPLWNHEPFEQLIAPKG